MGRRYREDIFETMGDLRRCVEVCRRLFQPDARQAVKELIDICHAHKVQVSTGGKQCIAAAFRLGNSLAASSCRSGTTTYPPQDVEFLEGREMRRKPLSLRNNPSI
jgi:hypothetical protein